MNNFGIDNCRKHLEWAAAWPHMGKKMNRREQKERDAGEWEKILFCKHFYAFPHPFRLSSSPFPVSALSPRDERTNRRRDEANRSWEDKWGDNNRCHPRLFPERKKTQEEGTSISTCWLTDDEMTRETGKSELKAWTVNMPAFTCVIQSAKT